VTPGQFLRVLIASQAPRLFTLVHSQHCKVVLGRDASVVDVGIATVVVGGVVVGCAVVGGVGLTWSLHLADSQHHLHASVTLPESHTAPFSF